MSTQPQCSKGWAARCARSKGKRCRCACHGENHGNPAARRNGQEDTLKLTPSSVFQPEYICSICGKPIPKGDEPGSDECDSSHLGDMIDRDYREFLPGTENVRDVHCVRHGFDGLVDIPQQFVVHSPTGMNWGYGGSGPADLALNVLALFVHPVEAWRLHQWFKWDVVARIPQEEGGVIRASDVREWIRAQWTREKAQGA